jgi:hypothetical protein
MAGISTLYSPQRHESLAIVFLCPRPLTSCVESDDYFSRQRLGQEGAAVERSNGIGDIIALTANQTCAGHGDLPVNPESPSSPRSLRLRHPG